MREIRFHRNKIFNLTSYAFFHNYCQPGPDACPGWNTGALEEIELEGNELYATAGGFAPDGVIGELEGENITGKESGNTVVDRKRVVSYEMSDGGFDPSRWARWSSGCSDYAVARFPEAPLHGSASLRISSGPGCSAVCTRSPAIPVQGNQRVVMADWTRNGGWTGKNYLVFLDRSYQEIEGSQVSAPVEASDEWAFHAAPLLEGHAPGATSFVALQFCVYGSNAVIDHDYTSIGLER